MYSRFSTLVNSGKGIQGNTICGSRGKHRVQCEYDGNSLCGRAWCVCVCAFKYINPRPTSVAAIL